MFRVYIDEAGDRGHHPASSKHFVVSAVIVRNEDESAARNELAVLRGTLGRHPGHVLHFRKLTHAQKVKTCQDVAGFSIAAITNVIFCKTKLAGQIPGGGGVPYIKQADPMYLYAVRLLLERVSWYVDEKRRRASPGDVRAPHALPGGEAAQLPAGTGVLDDADPVARVSRTPVPYQPPKHHRALAGG